MKVPPETSSLSFAHRNAKLSRAHVERFASELALRAGSRAAALGYCGNVGRILDNVFLHEGQLVMRPLGAPALGVSDIELAARSDVASIVLELESLGQPCLANFFLATWLEESGDFDALTTLGSAITQRARPRSLLITHGLSGTGKTTLCTALAGHLGAVLVRNDAELVRMKQQRGRPQDPLPPGALIDRLERLASLAIHAGWPAIVESCFLDRAHRRRFGQTAAELGVPFLILECRSPLSAVRERLGRRRGFGSLFHGQDASAQLVEQQLEAQLARLDPLDEQERASTITVDTASAVDHRALAERILERAAVTT